jgi:hypothetical protein
MELKDIFILEIEGLSKTICDYTTDNYITSYAKRLEKLNYPEDKDHICLIIKRLNEWYDQNMHEIRNNQYIHNLAAHEKSKELLETIIEKI